MAMAYVVNMLLKGEEKKTKKRHAKKQEIMISQISSGRVHTVGIVSAGNMNKLKNILGQTRKQRNSWKRPGFIK